MKQEEIRKHAQRIIEESVLDFEYSWVYEDEELEEYSEEVWQAIHDEMQRARIEVKWD